ncbi:MAG TPA: efflux RND transporter periplasmic adaptor subunit [Bacteroidota bacterium]|nr:efflux RND transporter periplasmic adaptor subunit [Bacteroidota bacterium]
MKTMLNVVGMLLFGGATAILGSCNRTDSQAAESAAAELPAHVESNGIEIVFPERSPQLEQITTDTVRLRKVSLEITAPAHVAVSTVRSEFGRSNLHLFETQDLTQLYSDFVKSASARNRSLKQLERVRELRSHKVVAGKELVDAENEHAQAQAELGEKEGRLRASGIDPMALGGSIAGTVWVLADIPEGRLQLIPRRARVQVVCNSFTDEKWNGTILSIGDVVDPLTRTVKACVMLDNRGGRLRPGMFGTVSLDESRENVSTIPRSAVVNVEGKTFVFKRSGNSFVRTEIKIGAETHEHYVVTGGLKPGDIVASGGVILLKQLSFGY